MRRKKREENIRRNRKGIYEEVEGKWRGRRKEKMRKRVIREEEGEGER